MRRFEFKEGTSSKFWEVDLEGKDLTVRFGKIGTNGQTQSKSFPTEDKAKSERDKLIKEKTGKGYAEVAVSGEAPALEKVEAKEPAKPRAKAAPPPADEPGWIEAGDGYRLALRDGKLVCRNAKGQQLGSVPKDVKASPVATELIEVRDWLASHARECIAQVENWMLRSLPTPRAETSRRQRDADVGGATRPKCRIFTNLPAAHHMEEEPAHNSAGLSVACLSFIEGTREYVLASVPDPHQARDATRQGRLVRDRARVVPDRKNHYRRREPRRVRLCGMRSMRRWILVAVSLVACSSETSSGVPARGPIPLDGWYSESARVQCEQMFRCCDKSKLSTGTLDECAALLAKRELEEEQEIKAAVAAGKLSYDGAAARKCLDAQAALPCEAFGHEFDPACNAIIKGMAAEGQACERHYECVTRLCTGSMTAPAEQTCQHVPLVGEVCDLVGCDWDVAYCDDSSPRKCVAKKENGSPCSYSNECVSEYCDPTSRTCAALKPNGSPCSVYSECASGFCDETRTCRTDLESLCR